VILCACKAGIMSYAMHLFGPCNSTQNRIVTEAEKSAILSVRMVWHY